MSTQQSLTEFAEQWVAAEGRGDVAFLARSFTDQSIGITPRGVILTKDEWLHRHSSGDLKYKFLKLADVKAHSYGDAAVITARETQDATYRGYHVTGDFTAMLFVVKDQGTWRIAAIHLGPLSC